MIELSKHIEILLLEHNCVIVPQLGGFIAQDVPARYVAEENLFLPPHRTVGFNPQLTLNDGLLVQSYMQAYDTNYPETIKLIEQAVSSLKDDIQHNGSFELNGIGKLSLNIDGQYNFEPNEAGILSPSLYGLDSVVVKPLENKVGEQPTVATSAHEVPNVHKNTKNYTFSINKELVNYVAAAVVAIIFYFLWATPVTDASSISAQQASMLFPHNIQHIEKNVPEFIPAAVSDTFRNPEEEALEIVALEGKDAIPTTDIASYTEKQAVTETAPVAEISNQPEETVAPAANESYYTIVLVSCVPLKNAEAFSEDLKSEGYKAVSVLQRRHIVRVVHGKYASESEAHNELNKLRKQSDLFKEAWVLFNK